MTNLNFTALDPSMADKMVPMVEEIIRGHSQNIHSVHIVGSAVLPDSDYNEKLSDINSVVMLHNMDLKFISFLAPLGEKYAKKRIAAPFVMTPQYLRTSLDAFPVEFLDFKLIHATVYGEDVFDTIKIEKQPLRLQCERDIKIKLIGLQRSRPASLGQDSDGMTKHSWMDVDRALFEFGSTRRKAVNEYRRFMQEGFGQGRLPELTGGGLIRSKGGWSQVLSARRSGHKEEFDERILGSGDFVNSILKEAEEKAKHQLKLRRSGRNLAWIVEEECKRERINPNELRGGGRRRKISGLRSTIAKRGRDELGLSLAEIARHVGVNTSSIRKAILRLEEACLVKRGRIMHIDTRDTTSPKASPKRGHKP